MAVANLLSAVRRVKIELDPLRDPNVFLSQVVETWRIAAVVVALQVAAGIAGMYVAPFHDAIRNLWAAGVVASVPGVLLGTKWELANSERRLSSPRPIRVLYVLSAVALSLVAIPMILMWKYASV